MDAQSLEDDLAELARAAQNEAELSDERLTELYYAVTDAELEAPQERAWSEALGQLHALAAKRPHLGLLDVIFTHDYAIRLDRETRRTEALEVLRDGVTRRPDEFLRAYLHIELGALQRDEHRFRDAFEELDAAVAILASVDRAALDATEQAYLPLLEALIPFERGAVCAQLGMIDEAERCFADAETKALAMDEAYAVEQWAATVVYRLTMLVELQRPDEARELVEEFDAHPWRERVPAETRDQIAARYAHSQVRAAFVGAAPPGAGREELRALCDESALKPDERIRAGNTLTTSLLDGGLVEEAEVVLSATERLLEAGDELGPVRFHALGLRARLLALRGTDGGVFLTDELRPACEAFLDRWARGTLQEAGVGLLHMDWTRRTWSELIALELGRGDGARRAFDWLLRFQAVGTQARELGLAAPTLREVQSELLGPGQGLLAYAVGRERSHLFAVDAGSVRHVPLAALHELTAAARAATDAARAALYGGGGRGRARRSPPRRARPAPAGSGAGGDRPLGQRLRRRARRDRLRAVRRAPRTGR